MNDAPSTATQAPRGSVMASTGPAIPGPARASAAARAALTRPQASLAQSGPRRDKCVAPADRHQGNGDCASAEALREQCCNRAGHEHRRDGERERREGEPAPPPPAARAPECFRPAQEPADSGPRQEDRAERPPPAEGGCRAGEFDHIAAESCGPGNPARYADRYEGRSPMEGGTGVGRGLCGFFLGHDRLHGFTW